MADRCAGCGGRGQVWSGRRFLKCQDCLGTGRVNHCLACVRRPGWIWLGGGDYLECPNCEGTGKPKRRDPFVAVGGIFAPAPRQVLPVFLTARDP